MQRGSGASGGHLYFEPGHGPNVALHRLARTGCTLSLATAATTIARAGGRASFALTADRVYMDSR